MAIERIQKMMKEQGLDVFVATAHDSVFYLTQAYNIPARTIPTRLTAIIIPAYGKPVMVACIIQKPLAEKSSQIHDIVYYREYVDSPIELVEQVVSKWGLSRGKIGVEKIALAAFFYDELKERLPEAEFVQADNITNRIRMVKTPREIAILEKAALATDRAIHEAFAGAKPGVMEKSIQDNIGTYLLRNGADIAGDIKLGAGPNAALSHPKGAERPLENGEILRTDAGGTFSGYMSDLARTIVVGTPTAEQEEYWLILYNIHTKLINVAKPGVKARELHDMCLDLFKQNDLIYAYTITGHALGLGLHDSPIIGPDDETVLEENMVINLEPAHRNMHSIMHIEDTILITPSGGKILSRSADWSSLKIS